MKLGNWRKENSCGFFESKNIRAAAAVEADVVGQDGFHGMPAATHLTLSSPATATVSGGETWRDQFGVKSIPRYAMLVLPA